LRGIVILPVPRFPRRGVLKAKIGWRNGLNETWYDNRPCDRFQPGFKRTIYILAVVIFVPGTMLIYFLHVLVGGYPTTGLVVALVFGGYGGALFGLLPLMIEANAAVEVSLTSSEILWRTRAEKIRNVSYGAIDGVITSRWKGDWTDGVCGRYVVLIRKRLGVRVTLWLTPDNKARLDGAMRRAGEHTSSFEVATSVR